MAIARTRADIRREVAVSLGSGKQIVQTTDSGAFNTFTDVRRLNDEDTYYAGADIVITSGPDENLNEVRYVLNSERTSSTLTVTPDWNAIPVAGTQAELYNLHGMDATVPEWNSFINQAVNEAGMLHASVQQTVPLGVFTADSWTDTGWTSHSGAQQSLPIPAGIDFAGPVTYATNGRMCYPDRGGSFSGEGWWIDTVTRRVVLAGDLVADADGATFYLVGWGPPDELHSDQDVTELPAAWLYAKVKALAYARVAEKGLFDLRGESTKWEGIAKDAQRLLRPGEFPANTVRLW